VTTVGGNYIAYTVFEYSTYGKSTIQRLVHI